MIDIYPATFKESLSSLIDFESVLYGFLCRWSCCLLTNVFAFPFHMSHCIIFLNCDSLSNISSTNLHKNGKSRYSWFVFNLKESIQIFTIKQVICHSRWFFKRLNQVGVYYYFKHKTGDMLLIAFIWLVDCTRDLWNMHSFLHLFLRNLRNATEGYQHTYFVLFAFLHILLNKCAVSGFEIPAWLLSCWDFFSF